MYVGVSVLLCMRLCMHFCEFVFVLGVWMYVCVFMCVCINMCVYYMHFCVCLSVYIYLWRGGIGRSEVPVATVNTINLSYCFHKWEAGVGLLLLLTTALLK